MGEKIDTQLLVNGDEVCDIVSQIRGFKSQNNLSMKAEINEMIVTNYSEFVKENEIDIKAVGSVNNIIYKTGEAKKIEFNN